MEHKILLLEDDVSLIDGLTYSLDKNGYVGLGGCRIGGSAGREWSLGHLSVG